MLNPDRIVNGQDAKQGIPWQVSIRSGHSIFGGDGHWCGGTILDAKTILSAAHCFYDGKYGHGKEYVKILKPFIKAGIIDIKGNGPNAQVIIFFYFLTLFVYFVII